MVVGPCEDGRPGRWWDGRCCVAGLGVGKGGPRWASARHGSRGISHCDASHCVRQRAQRPSAAVPSHAPPALGDGRLHTIATTGAAIRRGAYNPTFDLESAIPPLHLCEPVKQSYHYNGAYNHHTYAGHTRLLALATGGVADPAWALYAFFCSTNRPLNNLRVFRRSSRQRRRPPRSSRRPAHVRNTGRGRCERGQQFGARRVT